MAASSDSVRVVLKFVKVNATIPAVQFIGDSCPACKLLHDPAFERDNKRETLIALELPALRTLDLRFRITAGAVRRVILETGDLKIRTEGTVMTVQVPPIGYDAVTAGEMFTHIVATGMVLRFEHADVERRAGAYADGEFPRRQRQAVDNIEFAQREVIRSTGLGEYVASEKIGAIELMGFDTNYPHGHTDSPPHMHMHLRWPNVAGTQIGHYYVDDSGLLVRNTVGIRDLGTELKLNRGQAFTTRDMYGRPVFTHTITNEGWLQLGRGSEPPCLIRPAAQGFDSGAIVECPKQKPVTIRVSDDMRAGVLSIATDAVIETFRYDPDTGKLLSDAAPPPMSESNYK